MTILALDDEKIALEGLVSAIQEAEPSAAVFSFRKPAEALEFFKYSSIASCGVFFSFSFQFKPENEIGCI